MRNAIRCCSLLLSWLPVLYLSLFSTQLSADNILTCNRSPVITCPQNYFGCSGDSTTPDDVGWATAVAGESDCSDPEISYMDQVENNDACNGGILIKRLWRAEYPDNSNPWLFAECTQIILLQDEDIPVISNCPTNITVNSDQNCTAVVTWTEPTVTDDCGVESFQSNISSGSTFNPGTTTVTYTAIDSCGRSETCSFTVIVIESCCQESPSISCPDDFTGCVGSDISPQTLGTATASFMSDQCGDPVISYTDVDVSSGGLCAGHQVIDRIWKASYANDSTVFATCTQRIELTDNSAPVITACQEDTEHSTISPSGIVIIYDDPVVSDDCGIASITPDIPSGSVFTPGVTTVTFTVTDLCGNSSTCSFDVTVILVACQDAPVLICPGTYEGCISSGIAPSVTGQANATYSSMTCDSSPDLSYSDETVSTGTCSGEREILRTWTAVNPDDLTMSTSCVQTIILRDQTAPIISSCSDDIALSTSSSSGAVVNYQEVIASDDCGIASIVYSIPSGSVFPVGTTVVNVVVTDDCGNSSSCSFNVEVTQMGCQDTPNIACPNKVTVCVGSSIDPAVIGAATATFPSSSCIAAAMISYEDEVIATGSCSGARTVRRTWTAINPENMMLRATCIQEINVEDNQSPIITECPNDIDMTTISEGGIVINYDDPVVSDDCGISSAIYSHPSGSVFLPGTTTVSYTVTDLCGRVASCSFDVVVTLVGCQSAPVITCPDDFVACPNSGTTPDITGQASATYGTNACTSVPTITYNDVVSATGECDDARLITRTWTATNPDDANQTASCIQIITLEDSEAPNLSNCPVDVTITSDNSVYTWTMPNATDNCNVSLSSDVANGSDFPIGTTAVTITATDDCGNSTQCSFDVTVEEENVGSTLVINCPEDIVMVCDESEAIEHLPLPEVNTDCNLCNGGEIPGFIYMGKYEGNRYYCSRDKTTWEVAQGICEANGGYLAKIESQSENSFLANKLQTNSAYIGLNDATTEGDFRWADGTQPDFVNWYPRQPNDYKGYQDYVELLRNGLWNDQYNNLPLEYIMEVPCYTITQTAGPDDMSDLSEPTTVSYEVSDACGNVQTCSFDIIVEQQNSLACPDNLDVQTPSSFAYVSYDLPEYTTCCMDDGNTQTGAPISGYVYMGYYNGSYYYCSREDASWHDANQACRMYGGYLADIGSAGENSFLANQLINQTAFIGVSDHINEGTYLTVNNHEAGYYNWKSGQPNNYKSTQHYIELDPHGEWNDTYGNVKREYIMEIPAGQSFTLLGGLPSGAAFPVGTTTVTYEASDACGNSQVCSFDVNVTSTDTGSSDYCESYASRSSYGYIKESQIGNLLFQTGNNGGYANLTDHCVTVSQGGELEIKLTPGFGAYRYYCYYHIYIDYNGDGDFNDDRELIGRAKSANSVVGTLPIPAGSRNGNIRMRVIMSLNGYPDSACDVVQYGEVEDYCLTVSSQGTSYVGKSRSAVNLVELSSEGDDYGTAFNLTPKPVISPNPVRDAMSISYDNPNLEQIQLVNMNGQMIRKIAGVNQRIDVSELSGGLYLLKFIHTDGSVNVEKFMVE